MFEAQEEIQIADDAALERLVKTGAIHPVGKSVKNFRVDENHAGMVIGSEQVLPRSEIYSGLAADGCIHLGEDRGGNLNQVDATHVERGEQPGDIADYASAERDQDGFAVCAQTDQSFRHGFNGGQLLGRLAVGNLQNLGFEARGAQRFQQFASGATANRGNRNHKKFAGLGQKFGEQSPSPWQEAVFNPRLVGPRWNVDGDLRHGIP